jgi:RNA-directed DNA polymerase
LNNATRWRDWKGDLVPDFGAFFGEPIRVTIPEELSNETALLTYLDVSTRELKKIWHYRGRMYRHFPIAKNANKFRLINAPDQRLKFLQRKLADRLNRMYRPRKPVHGFVADRSVRTNALSHMNRRFVLNVDLADFFPTISENRVQGLLYSLGVNSRVADIIARFCCNNGHLPQGAPSSPVLSNMICFRLDRQLMAIARDTRCIYTRYADDITFSSHQPPVGLFEATLPPSGRFSPDLLAPKLREAFQHNGFIINPDKVHYADRHSRRIVTGLKVNELLNVDRRYVRNIRAALHSIEKLGPEGAQQKFRDEHGGRSSLAAHLQGKIAFLTYIKGRSDPVVRGVTLRFNTCFSEWALKVDPTPTEIRDRSVWVVDNDAAIEQGTAFFLKDVGLVTAAHCVKNASEVEVYHPTKPANKFSVRVLKQCEHRDLALLEHDIASTEYFELVLSSHVVAQGDHLTAVGYPGYGPGDRINARAGTVSSLTVKSGVEMIEVTRTLTQGMSGGPLLYGDDGVVGIIHKGGPGEGRNFAVGIKMLIRWLEEK